MATTYVTDPAWRRERLLRAIDDIDFDLRRLDQQYSDLQAERNRLQSELRGLTATSQRTNFTSTPGFAPTQDARSLALQDVTARLNEIYGRTDNPLLIRDVEALNFDTVYRNVLQDNGYSTLRPPSASVASNLVTAIVQGVEDKAADLGVELATYPTTRRFGRNATNRPVFTRPGTAVARPGSAVPPARASLVATRSSSRYSNYPGRPNPARRMPASANTLDYQ